MDFDWKMIIVYAIPIACAVTVLSALSFTTFAIRSDMKEREALCAEVTEKIRDGYIVRIDNMEVGNAEVSLLLDNFNMYTVAIDNEERVIAATKKPQRGVGFVPAPVSVPVTFR